MKPIVWILAALCVAAPAWAEGKAPLLAVLEFDSPDEAMGFEQLPTLTDTFRSAVVKEAGARYKVLTRETMLEIVPPEQLRCFAGKCVAEIGRMLQAQVIMAGSVRRFGSRKVLTIEAYESNGGRLLGSEQVKGTNDDELLDSLEKQARGLVRTWLGGGAAPPVPVASEKPLGAATDFAVSGSEELVAQFDSDPPGAVVMLDGKLVCRATPCTKAIVAGAHAVSMSLEQYEDVARNVEVSKAARTVRMALAPLFGTLVVEAGATPVGVSVDGKLAGNTPLTLRLDPGSHDVLVEDRCFQKLGQRVVIERAKERKLALMPVPRWAAAKVTAVDQEGNDLEAEVAIDGQPQPGKTPMTLKLPLCSRQASVSVGNERWQGNLALDEGKTTSVVARVWLLRVAGKGAKPSAAARSDSDKLSVLLSVGGSGGALANVFASSSGFGDDDDWRKDGGKIAPGEKRHGPVNVGDLGAAGGGRVVGISDLGAASGGGAAAVVLKEKPKVAAPQIAFDEGDFKVSSASVDKGQLGQFIKMRMKSAQGCYEKELKLNPSLKGKIVVRFVITTQGRVGDVSIESNSMGNDNVAACIRRLVTTWTFPIKPEEDSPTSFSFVFSSDSAPSSRADVERLLAEAIKLLSEGGKPGKVVALCDQVLAAEPNNMDALYDRGVALVDLQRSQEAIEMLLRAIEVNPTFKDAIIVLADTYKANGQGRDALKWYRRFLEIQTTGPDADMARQSIEALSH